MWINTQISSFTVPEEIWNSGAKQAPFIPPLAFAADDALEIKRRADKGVNFRSETPRYTICCESLQNITLELYQWGVLESPVLWTNPLSLLAVLQIIRRLFRRSGDFQEAMFLSPTEVGYHSEQLRLIRETEENHLPLVLEVAATRSDIVQAGNELTVEQCADAFEQYCQLVVDCSLEGKGMVHVLDIG